MLIKCKKCGKELSIHILSSSGEWEEEKLYCSECDFYHSPEEESTVCDDRADSLCLACGRHYKNFLEEGHLSCASCYTSFAPYLEELMEKYHKVMPGKRPFALAYKAPSIAIARSQELCEYVLTEEDLTSEYREGQEKRREEGRWKQRKAKTKGLFTRKSFPVCSSGELLGMKKVIESVRLRAARNVEGLAYLNSLSESQKGELSQALLSPKGALSLYLLENIDSKIRPTTLDTGDEDHLRVSWLFAWPGKRVCMENLFACLKGIELLDRLYHWQFHPEYGFLTACPALAGQALRLSFQLRIPALLANSKLWQAWSENLSQAGYEIRGIEGERELSSMKVSFTEKGRRVGLKEGRIQVSNRHWAWGESTKENIRRFFLLLEPLVEAEYKAGI